MLIYTGHYDVIVDTMRVIVYDVTIDSIIVILGISTAVSDKRGVDKR